MDFLSRPTNIVSLSIVLCQKSYNRPVELSFLGLNDRTLVGSATFCLILKLSCDFIHHYIVLYLFFKKATSPAD